MVATMRPFLVASAAGLLIAGGTAAAETTVQPQDSGFAVSVIGSKEGMEPQAFATAVVESLPEELRDPKRNFTTHESFDPGKSYRLVIAFHDAEANVTADLCRPDTEAARTAERADADFESMASTVGVAAALCEGDRALSTSANRSVGRVQPGDLSFGFLVSDTVKDLFPDGFAVLPQGRGDTDRTFGSTVGTDESD
ncbi:hypothetical protein [Azospirillum sp. ST 5-10]|uniref:hypothetical protein n=1 Tax=unclassified Azospirillum TaxID=2630922 RepID=UPI003F49F445